MPDSKREKQKAPVRDEAREWMDDVLMPAVRAVVEAWALKPPTWRRGGFHGVVSTLTRTAAQLVKVTDLREAKRGRATVSALARAEKEEAARRLRALAPDTYNDEGPLPREERRGVV